MRRSGGLCVEICKGVCVREGERIDWEGSGPKLAVDFAKKWQ